MRLVYDLTLVFCCVGKEPFSHSQFECGLRLYSVSLFTYTDVTRLQQCFVCSIFLLEMKNNPEGHSDPINSGANNNFDSNVKQERWHDYVTL